MLFTVSQLASLGQEEGIQGRAKALRQKPQSFLLCNLKSNILSLLQVRIKLLNPAYTTEERIIGGLEYQEVGIIDTALQAAEHTDFPAFALVPW